MKLNKLALDQRFRGFLPVVVDIETGGVEPKENPLLEVCIVLIRQNEHKKFMIGPHYFEHIIPFEGAVLDQKSLDFNQIDPHQPLRFAIHEKEALEKLFIPIQDEIKNTNCQRAVLVGHNAWFDLLFLKEAVKRNKITCPFHAFTSLDTATLSALLYGQTVLSKAVAQAGIEFESNEAHSAIYDAVKTAELFCHILNTTSEYF